MADNHKNKVRLFPLAQDMVESLHQRWRARMEEKLDAALSEIPPEEAGAKREALRNYLYRAVENRAEPSIGKLREIGRLAKDDIAKKTGKLRDYSRFVSRHRGLRKAAEKASEEKPFDKEIFSGETRIYLPIVADESETRSKVEAYLREILPEEEIAEIDYKAGYVIDHKGCKRKIGKLLKKSQELLEAFRDDDIRTAGSKLVVLSRDPNDIARMSTGRGWRSCMSERAINFRWVPKEIEQGSLIAYLIKESDPDIADPLARITLKPYIDDTGRRILRLGPTYGLGSKAFRDTLDAFLNERMQVPSGVYIRPKNIYPDGMGKAYLHDMDPVLVEEMDVENVLKLLRVSYRVLEDGTIRVRENLDISGMGLSRFPAGFDRLVINGTFSCHDNKLTSLEGGPRKATAYNCKNNELTSLKGAPKKVTWGFYCDGNRLTSLEGGPKKVGLYFSCSDNELVTLKGAPIISSHRDYPSVMLCNNNKLTSLKGAPENLTTLYCNNNELTTLQGMPIKLYNLVCNHNKLTSLEGLSQNVKGYLDCSYNKLTTLKGAPERTRYDFICSGNRLIDLEGAPRSVGRKFDCSDNRLVTLEGGPEKTGGMYNCKNNALTSLLGGPKRTGGSFVCSKNKLTNLRYAPEIVKQRFDCSENELITLEGAPRRVGKAFLCSKNKLKDLTHLSAKIGTEVNSDHGIFAKRKDVPETLCPAQEDKRSFLFFR